jgi:hypothetical protein
MIQGNALDLLGKGQEMIVQQHCVRSEEEVLGSGSVNDDVAFR